MSTWTARARADMAASAPGLPRRYRILGHAVLLKDRPDEPDEFTDSRPQPSYAQAVTEANGWNATLTAGRAVVVEFREVPC